MIHLSSIAARAMFQEYLNLLSADMQITSLTWDEEVSSMMSVCVIYRSYKHSFWPTLYAKRLASIK